MAVGRETTIVFFDLLLDILSEKYMVQNDPHNVTAFCWQINPFNLLPVIEILKLRIGTDVYSIKNTQSFKLLLFFYLFVGVLGIFYVARSNNL